MLMAYPVGERTLLKDEIGDETLAALTRQRRISNAVWLVAAARALVAPPVAVGPYVLATALMLALPFLRAGMRRS
jgi:hypothetical protein